MIFTGELCFETLILSRVPLHGNYPVLVGLYYILRLDYIYIYI